MKGIIFMLTQEGGRNFEMSVPVPVMNEVCVRENLTEMHYWLASEQAQLKNGTPVLFCIPEDKPHRL